MGVYSSDGTSNNVVAGNYIGTDADGRTALGNGSNGILVIVRGAQYNTIERNLISGNVACGVQLSSDHNTVAGNYIGTDVDGSKPIPNGNYGVLMPAVRLTAWGPMATAWPTSPSETLSRGTPRRAW